MNDFTGGPGFLAFVFTFTLAVGAVLLFRSMAKHLRKVKGASTTSSDLSGKSGAAASATSASIAEPADASSGTAVETDTASSPTSDAGGDASGGDGD